MGMATGGVRVCLPRIFKNSPVTFQDSRSKEFLQKQCVEEQKVGLVPSDNKTVCVNNPTAQVTSARKRFIKGINSCDNTDYLNDYSKFKSSLPCSELDLGLNK